MSSSKKRQLIFLLVAAVLLVAGVSCNSKTTDSDEEIVVTASMVAVKNFYLNTNDSVLSHLDSVFFTIDLNNGVIFNADSLPKGTDVTKLVPSITFANTMTRADLVFTTAEGNDSTVNYLTNGTDSIDFTYPVKLEVTAEDEKNEFTYIIKVNVHKQEPDTIIWHRLSSSRLPSRFESPVSQTTIFVDPAVYCLIKEYNGEFTISKCTDLNEGIWEKTPIAFDFEPEIDTFTYAEVFYILNESGELFSSADLLDWQSTGETWLNILGAYNNKILGLGYRNENLMHVQYPVSSDYIEIPVEADFPIRGFSRLGVENNDWADKPFAILMGGVTSEAIVSAKVWAFDGSSWAVINDSSLPALNYPMMARYVVYRDTPFLFTEREFDVWLLFGGNTENNEINREVYLSYDNGVHWSMAPDMMQLPETIPALENADVIVAGYNLSADLADAWSPVAGARISPFSRASYQIEGTEITWNCPYMYIFGGYNEESLLSTTIWRGVLARLTFTPII